MVGEKHINGCKFEVSSQIFTQNVMKSWRCPINLKNSGLLTQTLAEADAEDGVFSSLDISVGNGC
jgi:hypothetical protein